MLSEFDNEFPSADESKLITSSNVAPSLRMLQYNTQSNPALMSDHPVTREISGIKPSIYIIIDSPASNSHSVKQPLKCLGDTGCDLSPIDQSLAVALQLPTVPIGAGDSPEFSLANNQTAQRLGKTAPLPITVLFMSGDADIPIIPSIQLEFQFEILAGVHGGNVDDHWILFGKDLIKRVTEELTRMNIDHRNLHDFLVGELPPKESVNIRAPADVNVTHRSSVDLRAPRLKLLTHPRRLNQLLAKANSIHEQTSESASEFLIESADRELESALQDSAEQAIPETIDDLIPNRSQVFTEKAKETEYNAQRELILRDSAILEELRKNSLINSPCTYPEAKIALILNEQYKDQWWKLSRRQYNTPQAKHQAIANQVQDWLNRKKIRIAPSGLLAINHPLLAVPKVSGGQTIPGKYRICIDPRILNLWLMTDDKFEIPHIRKALEKFSRKSIFGELDLEEAFLQFPLDEESCKYLSFTWAGTQYQFTCMPFGVKFMTSYCHRIISNIFHDLEFVDPYVDNLPFAAESWEEHRNQLLMILQRCNQWNLKVKQTSEPLKIGHSTMQCLGHIVTAEGVRIDPRKLDHIREWPRPATGDLMSSFLGFAGFIQQHIRHYSELASTFNEMKSQKEINWNDEMIQEFDILKNAIIDSPMLIYPDFTKRFCVATDASNTGCGGVLYHPESDDDLDIKADAIVAICSHKWSESQRNYSAYKKELYGLVYCLRRFHEYIWGRPDTIVFTDHKPLTYLFNQKELPVPLQQFIDHIMDYSFEIHHRPGILNILPDALSRMYERLYSNPTWGIPPNIKFAAEIAEEFAAHDDEFDEKGRPNLRRIATRSSTQNTSIIINPSEAAVTAAVTKMIKSRKKPRTADQVYASLLMEGERRGKRIIHDEEEQIRLINEEHQIGHFGRDAIFNKLSDEAGLWWPGMREQIQNEVLKCDACVRFNVAKHGFKPAEFIISTGVWNHIQMDCASFPESEDGYTTLLTIVDIFSGFVILFPMKGHTAETVAEKLWITFSLFGLPSILQSDNAPEFRSKVLAELNSLLKVETRFIAPWNPRCDGKVERAIGTVKSVIKKLLQGAE